MGNTAKIARFVAGGLSGAGLVVAAISNIFAVSNFLKENFSLTILISAALGIAAVYPEKEYRAVGFARSSDGGKGRLIRRYGGVLVILTVSVILEAWHLYSIYFPEPLPENEPIIRPEIVIPVSSTISPSGGALGKFAAYQPGPRIIRMGLVSEKTSYLDASTKDDPQNDGLEVGYGGFYSGLPSGVSLPTYLLASRFKVEGEDDNADSERWSGCYKNSDPRLLPALRRFVIARGRNTLVSHLGSNARLARTVVRRAAVLRQIIPQGAEWTEVASHADREAILRWVRRCVGLTHPVFLIVVSNPGSESMVLTGAKYFLIADHGNASFGSDAPGVTAEPLRPMAAFAHGLRRMSSRRADWNTVYAPSTRGALSAYQHLYGSGGRMRIPNPQVRPFHTPLVIPPRSVGSFELQLYPQDKEYEVGPVLMNIELQTTLGGIRTGEFFLDFASNAHGITQMMLER